MFLLCIIRFKIIVPAEVTVPQDPCAQETEKCRTIRCPYGTEGYIGQDNCHTCKCHNPCEVVRCREGEECRVEQNLEKISDSDPNYIPKCREGKHSNTKNKCFVCNKPIF